MRKIAIVMNSETNCGIHTYGLFSYNILKQSKKYKFELIEVDHQNGFFNYFEQSIIDGIIPFCFICGFAFCKQYFVMCLSVK